MEYSPLAPEQFVPIQKTGNDKFDAGMFLFWAIVGLLLFILLRAIIVASKTNSYETMDIEDY